MKSYISTVAFPNTGGIIVSNYTQWRNSIPKGFRNMRSAFFKKSKAGKFVNPNLMFTQISQMTQIKNENKYGMNRIKGIYKISSISSVGMKAIIEGFQPGE